MVISSRVAGRYAKSLVDIANETNQLDQVKKDVDYLHGAVRSSRELGKVLRSPIIKADKKVSILEAIGAGKISDVTRKFFRLLASKGRENGLVEILAAFTEQYNELKGIHQVKITTAHPMSEELKLALVDKVKKEAGIPWVQLEEVVNEKIIGGFIIEYDNKLLDTSILSELRDVKRQFLDNDYIYNIR